MLMLDISNIIYVRYNIINPIIYSILLYIMYKIYIRIE